MNAVKKVPMKVIAMLLGLSVVQPASAVTVFASQGNDGTPDPVIAMSGPSPLYFFADTGAGDLFGFGGVMGFDPSVLQAKTSTYGPSWQLTNPAVIDNAKGTVETLANVGFTDPPAKGAAVLLFSANFNLTGKPGTFPLSFTATPDQFLDGNGNRTAVSFLPSSVQVVPLPAAVWLMLSSMGVFAGIAATRRGGWGREPVLTVRNGSNRHSKV